MRSDSIKKAKDGVSGGVFYLGLAVIGVLAIPAAVLLGLIAGVWTLTDKLTALLSPSRLANASFTLLPVPDSFSFLR